MGEHAIEVITRVEAARLCGVCDRTMKRWEERGAIQPIVSTGPGGTVRFRKTDVEELARTHRRGTVWKSA